MRKLAALVVVVCAIAFAAPSIIGPVIRADNRDESTFPAASIVNSGGILFGTDAGVLYFSDGGVWTPIGGGSGGNPFATTIISNVASGGDALKILDGARINFSTADTSAYLYRSAADTIRTPGILWTDLGLTISDTIAGSGSSNLISITSTLVASTGKLQVGGVAASGANFGVRNSGQPFVVMDADTSTVTIAGQLSAASNSHVRATSTSTTDATGAAAVYVFGAETYDTLSEYDNTTGIFTAAKAGYYAVSAEIGATDTFIATQYISISMFKNSTATATNTAHAFGAATYTITPSVSTGIQLAAGDTLSIKTQTDGSTIALSTAAAHNYFTIDRIP